MDEIKTSDISAENRAEILNIIENFRLMDDTFMSKVFEDKACAELLLRVILNRDDLTVVRVVSQFELANYDYQCNNYRMEGKAVCTQHRISALSLYNAVLEDIRRLANEALDDDRQMISSIAERLGKDEKDSVRQAERELKKAAKRLVELDKLFAKLYEEHINGKVSERNYNALSATYEAEQTELESKIAELNETIKANREYGENAENFVDLIKQYADIDELTQALLNTLIERIEVHEPEEINGERIQKLDVYYKFVGRLD